MKRLVPLTLLLAVATGCVYVDDRGDNPGNRGGGTYVPPVQVDHAPYVNAAYAWCSYSNLDRDDVWSFEANVYDADGLLDVVSVWADVYDEFSGEHVDVFELYPSNDPSTWYSDWLAGSTNLDCWYPGYVVDVTVYDSFDQSDVMSIYPDTYR